MARQIFVVNATVVDANGNYNKLDGYPKNFDSRSYNDVVNKAKKRAEGDMSEVWGAMCKRDDRQMQVVTLMTADGVLIDSRVDGGFPDA